MPKNSSEFLTQNYGFITDYLAEAFHHQLKHTNRYEEVNKRVKLGRSVEGRDEKGIKKTVAAFLKILHPSTSPTDEEFCEYVAYAVECRRRVKEQLNKRKTDDEYAMINLSYIDPNGSEVVVYCPESRAALATQDPKRRNIEGDEKRPDQIPPVALALPPVIAAAVVEVSQATPLMEATLAPKLEEQHFTIHYGSTGYSYESMVGPYLDGAKNVEIEDPYIRATHQIQNFVRFCEVIAKVPTIRKIVLKTACDEDTNAEEVSARLDDVRQSLLELDIALEVLVKEHIHDREIKIDNGWHIKIGRGLDIYQKPDSWYSVGAYDQSLRKCLETKVDIFLE
jgi:ATP-dependent Lon protease